MSEINSINPALQAFLQSTDKVGLVSNPNLMGVASKIKPEESFSNILHTFLQKTSNSQEASKEAGLRLQMGDPNMTVEELAMVSNKASLEFNAVMSVRTKLMEAYQEIIRMPV